MKKFLILFGSVLGLMAIVNLASFFLVGKESEENISRQGKEVIELIDTAEYEEARNVLESFEEKDIEYYTLKEALILEEDSDMKEEELKNLYIEATDAHPSWVHMQQMASYALILEGNYEAASYRLLGTLYQDAEDPITYYYLGVVSYHQGEYDAMRANFSKAIEYGLNEEKQKEILWYAEQVGDE